MPPTTIRPRLFTFLTLFPEIVSSYFSYSIPKRAIQKKLIKTQIVNIRDFAEDNYKTVDGKPYGGGKGMILKFDIISKTLSSIFQKSDIIRKNTQVILPDPAGIVFNQKIAKTFVKNKIEHIIFICGHYEGIDDRVRNLIDFEISIGDFIQTGGELPALVISDSIIRLIPGVISAQSLKDESFEQNLLEYPQFTSPEIYDGQKVPEILLSGHHAKIATWRHQKALERTLTRRPDLIKYK